MFKFFNHGFRIIEIYRSITCLGIEILLFIKYCPLKAKSSKMQWLEKFGTKKLLDLFISSILSDSPLGFQN